jgi:hypothetical protein
LALAALDPDSDIDEVELATGMDELKRRLEVLLGAKPEAADRRVAAGGEAARAELLVRRDRVAAAGGELLGAAFHFLGELMADQPVTPATDQLAADLRNRLGQCVEQDELGRQRLTVTLPGPEALESLSRSLARLLVIEVVSRGNKSSRHALRSLLDKTTEFLDRRIHLLFLDLHPPTPAIRRAFTAPSGTS